MIIKSLTDNLHYNFIGFFNYMIRLGDSFATKRQHYC